MLIGILGMFGCMHDLWTLLPDDITRISWQNYTNMVIGEHGIQTFKVVVILLLLLVLSFDVLVLKSANPLLLRGHVIVKLYRIWCKSSISS